MPKAKAHSAPEIIHRLFFGTPSLCLATGSEGILGLKAE